MSKIEDIVASFELCKMAIEVGLVIDSYCWWVENKNYEKNTIFIGLEPKSEQIIYPAPTADEIGLPKVIIVDGREYYITAIQFPTTNNKDYYWEFDYESVGLRKLLKREDKKSNVGIAEKLADAMLSLKIWLKENGYI